MIGEQQKNAVFPIVFSAVIVLLLAWHTLISCDYPYYFIWDMDYITALDTVLIQSGLLPDQICHPSFGMYLPLFFSEKIAHFFGILSALDLADIAGSLNPLAVMAELTDFVRLHSPFLSAGIALLLCMAIQVMFGMSRWWVLFFLVFLGVQESLAYHSSMVRSELYSVFYWGGAVLTMAVAAKAGNSVKRYAALLVTGLLLGLSFLTKIQSLFYLAAAPVLLLLAFSLLQDSPKQNRRNLKRKGAFWVLAVSLFNVAAFLVLGMTAYSAQIPQGVPTWAVKFRVMPIAVVFFGAFVCLFLFQLLVYLKGKANSELFRLSSYLSVVGAGFIVSFGLHFLIYSDMGTSLHYMLLDFKMIFFREPKLLKIPEPGAYVRNFLLYLSHNPLPFILNAVFIGLLVLGYRLGFIQVTKREVFLCLLASAIAFANAVVLTRAILRDTLWKEILVNLLSLFYFCLLVSRATRNRLVLVRVGSGLLIILFIVNCIHCYSMPDRLDAEVNYYGWQADKFFRGVYGRNQRKYSEIMREKYNNTTAWVARNKAVDHKRIRRIVDFVFKNQTITHKTIGIAYEGFSVWRADMGYRIAEVPSVLRGAILVDNASVELKRKTFFKEEHVRGHSYHPYKFKKSPGKRQISVLTRPDLRIFLFVDAADASQLVSKEVSRTNYKIVLRRAEEPIELIGLEIKNYSEIPLGKIGQKFFFVIRKI